jgi:DNA-binding beta-propeller fold protein YncE
MKRYAIFGAIAVAAVLIACSGGNGSPPVLPGAQTAQSEFLASSARRHKGKASITIRIPREKKKHRHGRDPQYISPATKSLSISVDGQPAVVTNLTASSPNCTIVGPISYLQCTVSFTVLAGHHTFSLITFDAVGGGGAKLSANTNVPFTVVSGSNTPLAVTLGGIATSIAVLPPNVPQIAGSLHTGFKYYGHLTAPFTILPVDADGYYIMGPGAPAVKVVASPSALLGVATPAPSSPNAWPLTSAYVATNPLTPASVKLNVTTVPVANSGATAVKTSVKFALYQPWVYVANSNSSPPQAIQVFDETGSPIALSGSPFADVPDPTGITFDPHNQWLYVPEGDGDEVCVYTVIGGEVTSVQEQWDESANPNDILYVPSNDNILTANNGSDGLSAGIGASDESGNPAPYLGATPYPSPGVGVPNGLAYDSNNGNVYETDGFNGTIHAYQPATGSPVTLPTPSVGGAIGIAFDTNNQQLYVVDSGGEGPSTVLAFNEGLIQQSTQGAWSGLASPIGMTYDPYNGYLYVADNELNTVFIYDENGNSIGNFSTGGNGAHSIAIVP